MHKKRISIDVELFTEFRKLAMLVNENERLRTETELLKKTLGLNLEKKRNLRIDRP